jgi:hypothetical protein
MADLLSLTLLMLATIFALAAASALHWLTLQATCRLMQPAAAHRPPRGRASGADLSHGTIRAARALLRDK